MVLEVNNYHAELEKSSREKLRRAYKEDEFNTKNGRQRRHDQLHSGRWAEFRELKLVILNNHHDAPTVAHPGIERTANAVKMRFWWESMLEDMKTYVRTSKTCIWYNTSSQKKQGMMQPMRFQIGVGIRSACTSSPDCQSPRDANRYS
ncbi:uncharacterized protein PHALS_01860 [Plasmopara halstedii]|uniref:Integrase zinc-binding domain-containing protein n=1 Tax=Plasmopara halstedii TaxID=4781 RepID=A0A0P1AXZ8_PLAHL|nr:uncharacterized protein PHALS_01860 [Plasmopara halstedii]CEG45574.1 hypothetical protein PHALS_01860 [Plasmopara halstedii]|eukprot:XP_024581943.1 hypothetical protein PHALS_01860 [Plasmopara halstedii]